MTNILVNQDGVPVFIGDEEQVLDHLSCNGLRWSDSLGCYQGCDGFYHWYQGEGTVVKNVRWKPSAMHKQAGYIIEIGEDK